MKSAWLINDVVLFEPDERRLCPLQDYPARCVILHGPVSECLLQLLEHNGEILSQRFLFDAVWGKQGVVVTTNALYQAIASIRKALKSAGLNDDIIKTIPKAGFKSLADLRQGVTDDFIPRTRVFPTPPATDNPPVIEEQKVAQRGLTFEAILRSPAAFFVAGLLFCLSCAVLYGALNNQEPVVSHYQSVGKMGNCDVYSSWYDADQSSSQFAALSTRYPVNCKPGDIAYMTMNRLQQGISIVVCNKNPQSSDARCRSLFYRQKYHESK